MFLRNRRMHSRVLLNADGWIATAAGDAWDPIKALDISKGGFAFVTKENLALDTVRQFRLQMPGGSRLMNFEARVTHCIDLHDTNSYRVGVEYSKVEVADMTTIEWYVDHKDAVKR
ncbi:MAG: PilZ domain-containing protein [Burkholderiales bacterium]|nr:PilZ domain-containing protein [Burkholderiales bacterium]